MGTVLVGNNLDLGCYVKHPYFLRGQNKWRIVKGNWQGAQR